MKIHIKVKPNSKQRKLEKIDDNNFLVWVKEKPIEGKANQAVVDILSECLGVAKSTIVLLKGESSRNKIFELL